MKRITTLKHQILDAFVHQAAIRQHLDDDLKNSRGNAGTTTGVMRTIRSAKWILIRNIVVSLITLVLVPVVIWLNMKGIFFHWQLDPSRTMTAGGTKTTAIMAPRVAGPSPPAATQKPPATPLPTVDSPVAQQSAATVQASPVAPDLLPGELIASTLDTATTATATLTELITAEENNVAATWCSLAAELNVAQCDSELSAQWAGHQIQSDVDSTTPNTVTIGQPSGTKTWYTYSIAYDGTTRLITMVWDGQSWHLSDQDYQQALLNGGILTPLAGSLTQVVLKLL